VALEAADQVDAVVRISESSVGLGGTVVVGVQVLGRGRELRVDRPRVRPDEFRVEVIGAPVTVAADQGNQVRMHLLPNCSTARALTRLDIEVPITPASGRRHVLAVPFPNGPDLVRRACGYLPPDEALVVDTTNVVVSGQELHVRLLLRNDGRELLTVENVDGLGILAVEPVATGLPVPLLPRGPSVDLQLALRVEDCKQARQLELDRPLVLNADSESGDSVQALPSFEAFTQQYRTWLARVCP
jgi:hypothetical protein